MIRFEKKPSDLVYAAIGLAMIGVFVTDVLTPLGYSVWVMYIVPVGLTLFCWRPVVPFFAALIVTLLTMSGFFLSSTGLSIHVSVVNRSVGMLTIWAAAAICYHAIRNKVRVNRQEWFQNGQARISDLLIGDLRLEDVGERSLRFLCEYLGAHVGVFYMRENDSLIRVASYAGGSGLPERVALADGLLGQAARDRRAFRVQSVADDHMKIRSALGESTPRSLLIAPIVMEGQTSAVIELGFVHAGYESDAEFVQSVADSIDSAIKAAIYRAKLHALLEETQRQSEELQTQSEELRVSNEELEEQSSALKESQARLELQQAELEQTNSQLEEQTQQLEAQKDDLLRTKLSLEEQARELDRASRYKSEFLANMSHELRTPLNSLLILSKLLADNKGGNLTQEQVKFAATINGSGNDLLTLINDILDLSKIEAGRLEVRAASTSIAAVAQQLRQMFEPIARSKGLELEIDVRPDTPANIHTDSQRLEQIARNLLSNAIKFTEKGKVALQIQSAAGNQIAFAVTDTGIGIPAEQQQIIFEAFRQADGTTNRKYGGTGLGLSISRELARLLGGRIEVASQVGKGSTFTLTLPTQYNGPVQHARLEASPVKQSTSAQSDSAVGVSVNQESVIARTYSSSITDDRASLTGQQRVILAVEDDEPFAQVLMDLAHEMGFQCLIATTAEEGLALAVQHVPSAIVLDIGLPDQSGLSVLDRLKRDVRTRHVPVHVVSASDYASTAMALGAVGYMLKPVKREELAQAFERLENKLSQRMRRVLIVEDDAVQLSSMRQLLGSRDVETVGAGSVSASLEQLRNNTFDCMVLDLSLPDDTGFSLLETLSREDQYSFPPAIVYTGRELTEDEEQRLRKYSKSIIIKGAKSPERLLDEVTLFLHQVVSEMPVAKQEMLQKAQSRESTLEGKRILIVEDDARNIFALSSILEPRGVQVRIARNGREALQVLDVSQSDSASAIDLVLMDLMMPEMDGLTATREIRKRAEWKRLPIIALTAKAMPSDQKQCLEAGANDYMAKPLDVEKLLSLVRVWMPR